MTKLISRPVTPCCGRTVRFPVVDTLYRRTCSGCGRKWIVVREEAHKDAQRLVGLRLDRLRWEAA